MKKRRKNWRLRLALLFYFLPILVVALLGGIRSYVKGEIRNLLPDEEYEEMLRFFNEPVSFPEEWAQVEPFSEELQEKVKAVLDAFHQAGGKRIYDRIPSRIVSVIQTSQALPYGGFVSGVGMQGESATRTISFLQILKSGEALTDEEWQRARSWIRAASPFAEALRRLSERPDYEVEAFTNLLPLQPGTSLLCLESFFLTRNGNVQAALDTNLAALRLARRHPASRLIAHLVGIAAELNAVKSAAVLVSNCTNETTLKQTIVEWSALEDTVVFEVMDRVRLIDQMGAIRWQIRENGKAFDLEPGKPLDYYWRQLWRDKESMWKSLEWREGLSEPDVFLLSYLGCEGFFARLLWTDRLLYALGGVPNFHEADIREKVGKTEFDLARLLIANRIHELESGGRTSGVRDFVPELIPVEPQDPFADGPFLWDATAEAFYSVGPDGIDHCNRIRYDPTNGTKSAGDISLP